MSKCMLMIYVTFSPYSKKNQEKAEQKRKEKEEGKVRHM